jgi:isoquinoline 1-oxidoreductase beta subunit
MNCTAHVKSDGCDVWVPTQNQGGTQEIAAAITGLDLDRVRVHTTFLGGGFGRRGDVDFVAEAVEISKAVNAPVKVMWTREEDIRNDHYRRHRIVVLPGLTRPKGLAFPCPRGPSEIPD